MSAIVVSTEVERPAADPQPGLVVKDGVVVVDCQLRAKT
jgi:hypothetical protein